jgi:hypothetical protein
MTPDEVNTFLAEQRVCRVATIGPSGPHATPLWFAWDTAHLWLYSITHSQRWADLQADPRVGVVVDTGGDYFDLRGVELTGKADVVGEVPRVGDPNDELTAVEARFARKNFGQDAMFYDGKHAWVRITPHKIVSWDFRKLADL